MSWPDLTAARGLGASLSLLAWLGLCATVRWRHHRAAHRLGQLQRRLARGERQGTAPASAEPAWWVVWASQTGRAQALALQTAQALQGAGVAVQALPMARLALDALQRHAAQGGHCLWVASTSGDGDPPESAEAFARGPMALPAALQGLRHAVLALGDRRYPHFCAFGDDLEDWLQASGSLALTTTLRCDDEAADTLRQWRDQLRHWGGTADAPDLGAPAFQPWRLLRREHLNPGSLGGPLYLLTLAPPPDLDPAHGAWQAGDLAQVQPPAPAPTAPPPRPRDYSIAGHPGPVAPGAAAPSGPSPLQLMVRLHRHVDAAGHPATGLASGWLCHGVPEGGTVALRLRAHPHFRREPGDARPLILLGNGAGLAGLRAHLQALAREAGPRRALMARGRNAWLLLGERQAAHDRLLEAELQQALHSGVLSRLDRVFSRDTPEAPYVGHRLRAEAATLHAWLADGAALYLCGSLQGLGRSVDAVLHELLGEAAVQALRDTGRLRRDVY
ncbi:NADPH cytochrome P450 oxidoreductase family protein [Ideonella livida]|uniref:NADPH--hemoprotein reductase n=1 Tax=Ideonella livida TaxID=2707176 RepID=A0A7C9PKU3_9BURK|nr:NADPH cytochrome P450 oxidoreductase family protein [Ideonella livida]NDY93991.1 hypothetical protein [Ideonella livida]